MKWLSLALLLGLCACGSVGRPGAVRPAAAPSPALSAPELQYRVVDTVGAPVACDQLQNPVVRTADPTVAAGMVAALRAQNPAEFDAIVRHEHLDAAHLSAEDDVKVLGQASILAAVRLTAQGTRWAFSYEVAGPPAAEVSGTVDAGGAVTVARRAPAPLRPCPLGGALAG